MTVDIPKLDYYLKFLQAEVDYLRKHNAGLFWAEAKILKLNGIAEVLRELRQERQMTTVGGKRIEG